MQMSCRDIDGGIQRGWRGWKRRDGGRGEMEEETRLVWWMGWVIGGDSLTGCDEGMLR